MRTTRPALVLCAVLALSGLAACSTGAAEPTLQVAGDQGPVFVGAGFVGPHQPVAFGSIILCLDRPGTATIREVTLIDVHGSIHLDAFGIRANPFPNGDLGIGTARSRLVDLGFDPAAPRVVDTACPAPGETDTWAGGSELALETSYDDPSDPGWAGSIEVLYDVGSTATKRLRIPEGIALCPAACPSDLPPSNDGG
jgi:hypothetical protein